jgi:PAB1-binding protein PBP1
VYRWIGGIVVGALVLALGVGCGGGGDSPTVSKAEFTQQANAICAKRKKEWQTSIDSYEKQVKEKKAFTDVKAQTEIAQNLLDESMLPAMQDQLQSLEDLGAPDGSEEQVEKWLNTLAKTVKEVEEKGVKSLTSSGFQEFAKQSKDLGVTCPV